MAATVTDAAPVEEVRPKDRLDPFWAAHPYMMVLENGAIEILNGMAPPTPHNALKVDGRWPTAIYMLAGPTRGNWSVGLLDGKAGAKETWTPVPSRVHAECWLHDQHWAATKNELA